MYYSLATYAAFIHCSTTVPTLEFEVEVLYHFLHYNYSFSIHVFPHL